MKKKVLFITIFISILLIICIIIGFFISNCISDKQQETDIALVQDDVNIETDNFTIDEIEVINTQETQADINVINEEIVSEKEAVTANAIVSTTSNKTTTTQPTNSMTNAVTKTESNTISTTIKNNNATNTNQNEKSQPIVISTSTQTTKSTESTIIQETVRCTNDNNHGMDVGNSKKWFNSQSEAIDYYDNQTAYWSKQWEKDEIDDKTYYKNCPYRI